MKREDKPKVRLQSNAMWRLTPPFTIAPKHATAYLSRSLRAAWEHWLSDVEEGRSGRYCCPFDVNFNYYMYQANRERLCLISQ